jgi:hypothetical protein
LPAGRRSTPPLPAAAPPALRLRLPAQSCVDAAGCCGGDPTFLTGLFLPRRPAVLAWLFAGILAGLFGARRRPLLAPLLAPSVPLWSLPLPPEALPSPSDSSASPFAAGPAPPPPAPSPPSSPSPHALGANVHLDRAAWNNNQRSARQPQRRTISTEQLLLCCTGHVHVCIIV